MHSLGVLCEILEYCTAIPAQLADPPVEPLPLADREPLAGSAAALAVLARC